MLMFGTCYPKLVALFWRLFLLCICYSNTEVANGRIYSLRNTEKAHTYELYLIQHKLNASSTSLLTAAKECSGAVKFTKRMKEHPKRRCGGSKDALPGSPFD